MNGQTILILGACVGVLLHRVVRRLSVYDAESGRHILRFDPRSSVRRAGRLLLAACKDDSIVYDWFLGARWKQRQRSVVWPMPITLTGGPANGRVFRLGARTGDTFRIPLVRKLEGIAYLLGEPVHSTAEYRVSRETRKAYFIGIR